MKKLVGFSNLCTPGVSKVSAEDAPDSVRTVSTWPRGCWLFVAVAKMAKPRGRNSKTKEDELPSHAGFIPIARFLFPASVAERKKNENSLGPFPAVIRLQGSFLKRNVGELSRAILKRILQQAIQRRNNNKHNNNAKQDFLAGLEPGRARNYNFK